eukprot:CAMPEP_0206607596 /NCGR_PEP_ID=MMETSP0325_2-20121206/52315_1 /ASSEMBLY_ACC=CAM_ASM_000347 /TAXON_ID=2866 /ORGANISM="Crypthecodinium cohnii, Strain Seligo" /LENGTH=567 /DNA_ID=CAMNT_0054124781 /DNA_START=267 /DNA_END=1970 /DNA_ORIENTATION=-
MAADSVLHAGDLAKKSDLLQLQTSLEQRFEKDFGKLREKLDVVDLEAKKRLVSHRQGLDELLEARFARWESRSSGVDEKLENFERRLQLIESTVAEQGAKTAVMEQVQKEAEFMHLGFSKAVTKDLHHLQDSLREILEECRRIVDARFQDCSDRCEQQLQESLRHAAASLPTTVTSEAAAAALAAQQAGQAAASGHYNGSFRPTGDQHFNNNSSSNNNNNNNSNSNQLPAIEDGSLGAATTTGIGLPYSSGEYGAIAQTEPVQVGRQTPSASPSQSPHRSSPGPGPNGSGPLARRASGSPLPPALAAAQLFANAIAKLALREARGEAAAARVQVDARHAELGVRCDALSGDVGRLRKTVDCIILELQEMGTVLDRNDSRRIEQLIHDLEVQIWPWRSARQWSRERASSPNRCRDQALPPPGQQQLSYNRSQKQQFTTTQQQHQHQHQQPHSARCCSSSSRPTSASLKRAELSSTEPTSTLLGPLTEPTQSQSLNRALDCGYRGTAAAEEPCTQHLSRGGGRNRPVSAGTRKQEFPRQLEIREPVRVAGSGAQAVRARDCYAGMGQGL